jgi:hypothetical protein
MINVMVSLNVREGVIFTHMDLIFMDNVMGILLRAVF